MVLHQTPAERHAESFRSAVLHTVIGKGNNVLDNCMSESQAAAEGHTAEHHVTEKQEAEAMKAHQDAKDELAQFNMVTSECEKDLKRQRKRNDLSDADRAIVEIEMVDVAEERTLLQDAVPRTKAEHVEAKQLLAAERKKPENGKAFGQPVNSKMDDVLKREGIDRAAQFGGTIEGNGARVLMEKCVTIIDEMVEFVLQAPAATRVAGTDEEV